MNLPKRCRQCREHQRTIHEARTTHARTKRRYRSTAISPHQQCRRHTNHQPVLTPVAGLIFSNVLIWIESCWLGSENRDRGGIQWYSEPTSAPGPLLKININYEGCSGLSNFPMHSKLRADQVPNTAKIATLRPEMMQRAQN